jgi:hypothetical protein
MNRSLGLVSLAALATSLVACATPFQDSRRWTEEVKLSDGRIINVEREEFLGKRIPLVERNTLKFKTADGREVRWESCAKPIALEISDKEYFVVALAEFSFCTGQLNLRYGGGLAAWKLEAGNSLRLTYESVPQSITANLIYNGVNAANAGFVSHSLKRGELHVASGIGWCIEGWIPGGDLKKCPTIRSN